jgi:hypothetical protein
MEEQLPIWKAAANILNKQSQTAERGGPPAWWLDEFLTNPHHKSVPCYKPFTSALDLDSSFGNPAQNRDRWQAVVIAEGNS